MHLQAKKISKTAETYIEALLSKLHTTFPSLNEKALNNTYSYTRQIEERAEGSRRNHNRKRNEEDISAAAARRRYKKITQADLIGKTAGRWTRQEHLRFI